MVTIRAGTVCARPGRRKQILVRSAVTIYRYFADRFDEIRNWARERIGILNSVRC